MNTLKAGLILGLLVCSAVPAGATTITVLGRPVEGIGSSTLVGMHDLTTGRTDFYIPISDAASGVYGPAGTTSDSGMGTGYTTTSALTMFLEFVLDAPITDGSLTFFFEDLDLDGVHDPEGFWESVRFYDAFGTALTPVIFTFGQSGGGLLDYFMTGDHLNQTITLSGLGSLAAGTYYFRAEFGSMAQFLGTNTPEALTATLTGTTSTPVPEPGTLMLVGIGLASAGARLRSRRKA